MVTAKLRPSWCRNSSPEKGGVSLGGGVLLRLELGRLSLPVLCTLFVTHLRSRTEPSSCARLRKLFNISFAPDCVSDSLPPLKWQSF